MNWFRSSVYNKKQNLSEHFSSCNFIAICPLATPLDRKENKSISNVNVHRIYDFEHIQYPNAFHYIRFRTLA